MNGAAVFAASVCRSSRVSTSVQCFNVQMRTHKQYFQAASSKRLDLQAVAASSCDWDCSGLGASLSHIDSNFEEIISAAMAPAVLGREI